ncbi:MAG: hypothetical protein QM628_15670 [Propionicimonas sp.]
MCRWDQEPPKVCPCKQGERRNQRLRAARGQARTLAETEAWYGDDQTEEEVEVAAVVFSDAAEPVEPVEGDETPASAGDETAWSPGVVQAVAGPVPVVMEQPDPEDDRLPLSDHVAKVTKRIGEVGVEAAALLMHRVGRRALYEAEKKAGVTRRETEREWTEAQEECARTKEQLAADLAAGRIGQAEAEGRAKIADDLLQHSWEVYGQNNEKIRSATIKVVKKLRRDGDIFAGVGEFGRPPKNEDEARRAASMKALTPEQARAMKEASRSIPRSWQRAAKKHLGVKLPAAVGVGGTRPVSKAEVRSLPAGRIGANGLPVPAVQQTGRNSRQVATYRRAGKGGAVEQVFEHVATARHPGGSGWVRSSDGKSWSRPFTPSGASGGSVGAGLGSSPSSGGRLGSSPSPRAAAVHQMAHQAERGVPQVGAAAATWPQVSAAVGLGSAAAARRSTFGQARPGIHGAPPQAGHRPQGEAFADGMTALFGGGSGGGTAARGGMGVGGGSTAAGGGSVLGGASAAWVSSGGSGVPAAGGMATGAAGAGGGVVSGAGGGSGVEWPGLDRDLLAWTLGLILTATVVATVV